MNELWIFGLLAAALTGFSLWAVFRPLLARAKPTLEDSELARRLSVLRDRKQEIEAEKVAGRLTSDDAASAIEQLAIELSETIRQDPANAADGSVKPIKWLAALIGVSLPAGAALLYLTLGAPQVLGLDPVLASAETTPEQLAKASAELDKRVAQNPKDLAAWAMLAQAQRMAGNLDASLIAFKQAAELAPAGVPETARLFAEYAETLVNQRQGNFEGEPLALLEQALKHNPDDQKALGLMGAGLYRVGKAELGIVYLRKLLASLPPDSEQNQQIRAVVQRIESEIVRSQSPSAKAATADSKENAAPTAATTTPASENAARAGIQSGAKSVTGQIQISDALKSKLPSSATIFIVARPADGQRMPVAVSRQPFSKLPFEFVLSDEQSMTAERKLSSYSQVILEARISASGNATRQSGDLFGISKPLAPGATPIQLLIDQVVP